VTVFHASQPQIRQEMLKLTMVAQMTPYPQTEVSVAMEDAMTQEMLQRVRGVKRRFRFLACTAIFVMALTVAVECRLTVISHHPHESWLPSVLYGAAVWLWWLWVVFVLAWLAERRPVAMRVSIGNLVGHSAVGLVIAYLHMGCMRLVVNFILDRWPELYDSNFGALHFGGALRIGLDLVLYGLACSFCIAARAQWTEHLGAMRSLKLERQLSAAHLRALQMQIEPHFLFNTLNAITTLVELDRRDQALRAILHLNKILRTTFKRTTPDKIPLAQELQVVESYLALEQMRYANRLQVNLEVQSDALDGLVPCFLLQPLIENAIRHGVAKLKGRGVITTSAERDGGSLRLTVRDNGLGRTLPAETGNGIGLRNTEERLSYFYNDLFTFSAAEPPGGGFEVSITIPYERKDP
jgi:hypothetical protein